MTHVILGWYIAIPLLDSTKYKAQFRKSKEVGNFTKEYEITRRETQRFYYETWKDMKSFAQKHTQLRSGEFRTKMKEQYVENMARLIRTREKDGFDRSRFEHTQQLSRYFQEHLKKSQNPDKCEDARFLVCYFNSTRNGWACMMHHVIFCLMVAFASKRVLLLDKPQEMFGFDNHFVPLTNCHFNSTAQKIGTL